MDFDLEKFITLYEELSKNCSPIQLQWIYSQLDNMIVNYNKKFKKDITIKFNVD